MIERYDREAALYRDDWAPLLREATLPLLASLAAPGLRRVLDVGAGVGALLPDLAQTFPAAFIAAGDRSSGMLRMAPVAAARIQLDAAALAVRDASIDRVLMAFMLFLLDEPLQALREARRVLQPGGSIGVLTWGGELESPAIRMWREFVEQHRPASAKAAPAESTDPLNTPEKVSALLGSAGLHDVMAWRRDVQQAIEPERLLRLMTCRGTEKLKFDQLPRAARAACMTQARAQITRLPAADHVARVSVVYATARR